MAHKAYYGRSISAPDEPYITLALAGARPDAGVSAAEINLKMLWAEPGPKAPLASNLRA